MQTTDVSQLNSLLRGEMSAIETYRQALEKVGEEGAFGVEELRALQRDHRDAADALWHHIEQHGAEPSHGSGPWGAFAKAVEGTARLFGDTAALKALKEGEEHGLKDYEEALKDSSLPADCIALLRSLAARQREHILTLDRLMERVSSMAGTAR
jgi:rubrerythrin